MGQWLARWSSLALLLGVVMTGLLLPGRLFADAPSGNGVLSVQSSTSSDCSSGLSAVSVGNGGQFDVTGDSTVLLTITPEASICVAGDPSKIGNTCTLASQCNSTTGSCQLHGMNANTCTNGSPSNAGGPCTNDTQCNYSNGDCEVALECQDGTIELGTQGGPQGINGTFNINNGTITACVDLSQLCLNGPVKYCLNGHGNQGSAAVVANPQNTGVFIPAKLNGCGASSGPETCTNTVGSLCCGLTQGAYGAVNSVATCLADNCNPIVTVTSKGWIPALFDLGTDIFAYTGPRNATTIGQTGKSVSIGTGISTDFLTDLTTLQAYLPATSTPGKFKNNLVSANVVYTAPNQIPDPKSGGSLGEGGGALSGNAMACGLNVFLSGTISGTDGTTTFTPTGFGGFTIGAVSGGSVPLICTRRSGPDKILGNADDICQAFLYPNCVGGLTVNQIKADADTFLSTGVSPHGCMASQLNVALDNINNEFDQCGVVIDCTVAGATGPGITPTCPSITP